MKPNEPQQTPPQPVAYDAEGRPLYAHPPITPAPVAAEPKAPQLVQVVRPLTPPKQEMSPEARKRHEASVKKYPFLNLSAGEYIVRSVRRHSIGLVLPLVLGTFLITAALTVLLNYGAIAESLNLRGAAAEPASVFLPVLLFSILVGLGMFVVYYVYTNNKFFLTNESVIQEIQDSIFSRHEQTVSLASIEDASFVQTNILQHIFNYGSIRLSTEGDETTYRFTYVANPKDHIAALNNAVEAFKMGRPVDLHDS